MNYKGLYSIDNRFMLGIALNGIFICVELFYGFRANSVALIADAVHNAADVFGLAVIWLSYIMSRRKAPHHFTFGYKNGTIFAAFANAIVIFVAVGNLIWGSLQRITDPQHVASLTMICVAAVGVCINGLTAIIFLKDRHKDLNIFGVFLNMAIDAAVSVGVVIAGIFIWWKGWYWLDPTMGLVIAAAIVYSSWGFFKESINLIFQAVPSRISFHALQNDLKSFKQVESYHDLHVWALSTTEVSLSVHIVVKQADYKPEVVSMVCEKLKSKYGIVHATIQLEIDGNNKQCQIEC